MIIKSFRYRLEVARFVLRTAGEALRLELDAVLDTNAPLASVRLAVPGREPHELAGPVEAPAEPLALRASLPAEDGPELDGAAIAIVAGNGDQLSFDLGLLLRRPGWLPRVVTLGPAAGGDPDDALPLLSLAAPDAGALADAIETGFEAIDADDLVLHRAGATWHATSHRYGLAAGTGLPCELDPAETRDRVAGALRDRGAALLAELTADAPLLLVDGVAADSDETVCRLHDALRARNPDAVLLWLDPRRAPGPVVRYRPPDGDAPPRPTLLLAALDADRDALLAAARDDLLSPRDPLMMPP